MEPIQISYRHCEASEALDAGIHREVGRLKRLYQRITGCLVVIESPPSHHRKGKGAHFKVRIELAVPGQMLVVSRDPEEHWLHEDAFVALREGFRQMRRQLEALLSRRRGEVKIDARPEHARIARLFHHDGYGFLQTADGREVYFDRASVLGGGFDRLSLGGEVRFAEEAGENGPQASSVHAVGAAGHHELPPLQARAS